jgi:hypothetical protein
MGLFGRDIIMGGRTQTTTLSAAILALSPVGYWKLNDTSGTTAADSSGNSRNGASSGSYTLEGNAGPDDDYTDWGNGAASTSIVSDNNAFSANTAGGLTIFALINPDSVAGTTNKNIITKGQGSAFEWAFSICAGVAGRLTMIAWNLAGSTVRRIDVDSIVTTGWQAVAARTESPTTTCNMWLFRNGSDVGGTLATSGATPYANGTSPVYIAYRGDSPANQYWQGGLAHVAIFAGQLTDGQILSMMTAADNEGWF